MPGTCTLCLGKRWRQIGLTSSVSPIFNALGLWREMQVACTGLVTWQRYDTRRSGVLLLIVLAGAWRRVATSSRHILQRDVELLCPTTLPESLSPFVHKRVHRAFSVSNEHLCQKHLTSSLWIFSRPCLSGICSLLSRDGGGHEFSLLFYQLRAPRCGSDLPRSTSARWYRSSVLRETSVKKRRDGKNEPVTGLMLPFVNLVGVQLDQWAKAQTITQPRLSSHLISHRILFSGKKNLYFSKLESVCSVVCGAYAHTGIEIRRPASFLELYLFTVFHSSSPSTEGRLQTMSGWHLVVVM